MTQILLIRKSKTTKLSGKEEEIKTLLAKQISYSAIGRMMGVHRLTVKNFVLSRDLKPAQQAG